MTLSGLGDVRVVELGSLIAGSYCGQLLADFGADVIKVEPPKARATDALRQWGHIGPHGESLLASVLNRGKRLLSLDISRGEGMSLLRDMLRETDILIENFRPGTLARWGLDDETIDREFPRLVRVSISGYGQDGPLSDRSAFGAICEAMGGMRSLSGFPDRPPVRAGVSIGDSLAGLFGAFGALVSLNARDKSGRGDVVDVAIYEAVMSVMEDLLPVYDVLGITKGPAGTGFERSAPSNVYACRGGEWVLIAASTNNTFRRLVAAMADPRLTDTAAYGTPDGRADHKDELDAIISEWAQPQTADAVVAFLSDRGVPVTKLNAAKDILADPHINHRGMVLSLEDSRIGTVKMQGVVPKLGLHPGSVAHPGREHGHDTEAICAELLGLSDEDIARLRSDGIL